MKPMEERIVVTGIEELTKELQTLISQYPDRAGELLEKQGKALRKEVVKNVDRTLGTAKSKRSLHKISSYRVSKAQGIGRKQYVEVSAKSPHFHLLERGHEIIMNGENKGFYPGKHMMADAVKTHQREMPKMAEQMLDQLLKERGLT